MDRTEGAPRGGGLVLGLLLLAYITGLDTVQRRSVRRRAMRVVHLR